MAQNNDDTRYGITRETVRHLLGRFGWEFASQQSGDISLFFNHDEEASLKIDETDIVDAMRTMIEYYEDRGYIRGKREIRMAINNALKGD